MDKNTETVATLMRRRVEFSFHMPGRSDFAVHYSPKTGFRTVYNNGETISTVPAFSAERFVPETVEFRDGANR